VTDFKERMIEAIERGQTTEANAYEYVRQTLAAAAYTKRKAAKEDVAEEKKSC